MTVSDFVRNTLNNQNVIIKYEITADVPEIKQRISQFGKIGDVMLKKHCWVTKFVAWQCFLAVSFYCIGVVKLSCES